VVDYLDNENLIFDRRALRQHHERVSGSDDNPLFDEIALRLADRLLDVQRDFPLALDIGFRGGECARAVRATNRIKRLIVCDPSIRILGHTDCTTGTNAVVADEEFLPFALKKFDLITSSLALHWTNDLPGALAQVQRALKPDGLFLAAMFAGETLHELREVLIEAELAERGGASPRVSPMIDIAEASSLLQRAAFALPVVDTDTLTLTYPNALALMADLRAMGETNVMRARGRGFTPRTVIFKAAELYHARYGQPDGRIRATFQIAYLTGWSPDQSQQQPIRPGSAVTRLADALNTKEQSAGEKAGPDDTAGHS
jgi:NADH dehydrogenase [ubiquinone] 1 alpha subcomplex assembly factor 5